VLALGNARYEMYQRCEGCKRCEGCQRQMGTGPQVVSANNFLARNSKTASAASHMEAQRRSIVACDRPVVGRRGHIAGGTLRCV
jgi:hypothetical protein